MPRGHRTSPELVALAVQLYGQGLNIPQVAERTGLPESTVFVILKAAGVATSEKRRRPRTAPVKLVRWAARPDAGEIDAAIAADYPSLGPVPIAARFGLTKGVISKRAWKLGVRCTTGIARKDAAVAAANTNCDQAFFETWSADLAWLLGYTWTDGAVSFKKGQNKVHYRCAIQDEHIIHDIRAAIRSTAMIQRFPPSLVKTTNKYTGQPQVGFSISSVAVAKLIVERYGIPPNKSAIDPPMPAIPDEWMPHFARGVIDGDGSICGNGQPGKIQVIIYGSHRFVEELRHRIATCASVRTPNRLNCGSSSKLSAIRWSATQDVITLLRWLYPAGNHLALGRKKTAATSHLASVVTPDKELTPKGAE